MNAKNLCCISISSPPGFAAATAPSMTSISLWAFSTKTSAISVRKLPREKIDLTIGCNIGVQARRGRRGAGKHRRGEGGRGRQSGGAEVEWG